MVDAVGLRVPADGPESLIELRWSASDPEGFDAEAPEEGVSRAALRSELRGLGIVTREEWGARSTSCGPVDGVSDPDRCEQCDAYLDSPLRQLLRMQNVSTKRRDRINSDEEERVRMGKHESFRGTSVAVSRSVAGMIDHPVADRLGLRTSSGP